MTKKPHNLLLDISQPVRSRDETHSTPETEFEKLKKIIKSLYQTFTKGQKYSYIHKKLKYSMGDNFSKQFWMQMYNALEIYGYPFDNSPIVELDNASRILSEVIGEEVEIAFDEFGSYYKSPDIKVIEEAVCFYLNSDKYEFCNFIEFSFRLPVISENLYEEKGNQLVEIINEIFRKNNHEFELSPFVYDYEDWDYNYQYPIVLEFPRVISKSESLMYEKAIEPALSVLKAPHFQQAYIEFLDALTDYRNEKFSDCLTKCGSAFESVLIILSDKLDIPSSKSKRNVSDRINLIVEHLTLDRSLIPVLKTTAVLRNKLSSAHGRGEDVENPSPHVAQYAINCTASAILLLVNESNS